MFSRRGLASQNIISLSSSCHRSVKTALPVQVDEEDIPFFAEVIAGGRITIPEEIRKVFGVKDGDHVMCRVRLVRKAEEVR
jgi:hypothetical protein